MIYRYKWPDWKAFQNCWREVLKLFFFFKGGGHSEQRENLPLKRIKRQIAHKKGKQHSIEEKCAWPVSITRPVSH